MISWSHQRFCQDSIWLDDLYKSVFFLFEPERQILGIICMRGTACVRGCEDLSAIRRTQRLRENKNAYDHVVCLKKKDVQKTREHLGIY